MAYSSAALRSAGRTIAREHGMTPSDYETDLNMKRTENYVTTVPNTPEGREAIEDIKRLLGPVRLRGRGKRPYKRVKTWLGRYKNPYNQDLPLKLADRIAVYKREKR